VDQESAASAAVVAWAAEQGVTGPDVQQRWADVSRLNYARFQRRELTFAEQRRARTRQFFARDLDDAAADELFSGYLVRYEAGWTLFDDAVTALRRARAAGLKAAIFTNGDEDHQRHKVKLMGLEIEVDLVIASSSLPAGKPDPRAFQHAPDRAGLDAREALMVGNSLGRTSEGRWLRGSMPCLLIAIGEHADVDVPTASGLDLIEFTSGGWTLSTNAALTAQIGRSSCPGGFVCVPEPAHQGASSDSVMSNVTRRRDQYGIVVSRACTTTGMVPLQCAAACVGRDVDSERGVSGTPDEGVTCGSPCSHAVHGVTPSPWSSSAPSCGDAGTTS
jgi:putative hydrolase of the HAD superfamily